MAVQQERTLQRFKLPSKLHSSPLCPSISILETGTITDQPRFAWPSPCQDMICTSAEQNKPRSPPPPEAPLVDVEKPGGLDGGSIACEIG